MNVKMVMFDGKMVNVISLQEYYNNWDMYTNNPSYSYSVAIEYNSNTSTYILPFRKNSDNRPGIYMYPNCLYVNIEDESASKDYLIENLEIIDFSDTNNIREFMSKNSQIRDMEASALTEVDSIFIPQINPNDSPEMSAFKEAIIAKKIDINKYASRFGDNFLNDKRILKTTSITMNKLISMCQKLDIEAELTLRDVQSDNIPNPMMKEITVILTNTTGDK